jgi:hypothetical protein
MLGHEDEALHNPRHRRVASPFTPATAWHGSPSPSLPALPLAPLPGATIPDHLDSAWLLLKLRLEGAENGRPVPGHDDQAAGVRDGRVGHETRDDALLYPESVGASIGLSSQRCEAAGFGDPAMEPKPVALLVAGLGVTKTHARPHISKRQPVVRGEVWINPTQAAGALAGIIEYQAYLPTRTRWRSLAPVIARSRRGECVGVGSP